MNQIDTKAPASQRSSAQFSGPQSQLVRASEPSSQTPQAIACSVVDQLLQNLSVSVVFFYKESLDPAKLIASMETVLNDFPLFAGRLKVVNHKLILECNNAGIRFSTKSESGTLSQLIQDLPAVPKHRFLDVPGPKQTITNQEPVFTIQLTQFTDGGTALGLCWHHAIGDMHTVMCLMKAWSAADQQLPYEQPLIAENRDTYIQAQFSDTQIAENRKREPGVRYLSGKSLLKLLLYLVFRARKKSTFRIYFSPDELNRMKQSFSQKVNQALSTNDVLCAHLCSWIAQLEQGTTQKTLADRYVAIAVNYRAKTTLSNSALGNFVETAQIPFSQQSEPYQIAQKIRTAVDNFTEQHFSYFSIREYIAKKGGLSKISRFVNKGIDPINKTLLITNWSNFGVYDIAFEGAKPFYFTSLNDVPFPWLSAIFEGCANQGLIYSVVLPSKLNQKLMQPAFLQMLHQYRDPSDALPTEVAQFPWLI